jgi:hypothetical protein
VLAVFLRVVFGWLPRAARREGVPTASGAVTVIQRLWSPGSPRGLAPEARDLHLTTEVRIGAVQLHPHARSGSTSMESFLSMGQSSSTDTFMVAFFAEFFECRERSALGEAPHRVNGEERKRRPRRTAGPTRFSRAGDPFLWVVRTSAHRDQPDRSIVITRIGPS